MSVKISGTYLGKKNVQLVHGPSGAVIKTAAPIDNNGDGSSFSPTDLVAGALGACMITVMGIIAERDGLDLSGARFEVEKIMNQNPRRIAKLPLQIYLPNSLGEKEKKKLELAALSCPVHKSLLEEIEMDLRFIYE